MLARINEIGTRPRLDTCTRSQIDRGKNTTKRFQRKGAFKI